MQKEKSKEQTAVACPFCGSIETRRETNFGTTLAYAQFYCRDCHTPFEWIKWEDKAEAADLPSFFLRTLLKFKKDSSRMTFEWGPAQLLQ